MAEQATIRSMQGLHRRLEEWQATHRPRSPLPDELWTMAVGLAGTTSSCSHLEVGLRCVEETDARFRSSAECHLCGTDRAVVGQHCRNAAWK